MKAVAILAFVACQFLGCHFAPAQRWSPHEMAKPVSQCVKPNCLSDDHPCQCPPDTRAPR